MGIIVRQSIKNTLLSYVGVAIAGICSLKLYPLDGAKDVYGVAQFLMSMMALFIPFSNLGSSEIAVKFFTEFEDEETNNHGLLSYLMIQNVVLCSVLFLCYILVADQIHGFLQSYGWDENRLLDKYYGVVLVLTFFGTNIYLLGNYSNALGRIVVPELLTEFAKKLFLPIIVLSFYFSYISEIVFCYLLIGFFASSAIALFVYVMILTGFRFQRPDWTYILGERWRRMVSYGVVSTFHSIGHQLAMRFDVIMIGMFLRLEDISYYLILVFMTSLVEIPNRAIKRIAGPIISKAWDENDMTELKKVYQKSSINLFSAGSMIFITIWYSLDEILAFSPKGELLLGLKYVFFFVGLSKLFDMLTSVNGELIIYSKWFRYNLLFILGLGGLNVWLNYHWIGEYGIVGAAMATCFALLVYNFIKFLFVFFKMGLQPFSWDTLKVLILSILVFVMMPYLPMTGYGIVDAFINGTFVLLCFLPALYCWRVSEEANGLLDNILLQVKKRFGNNKIR